MYDEYAVVVQKANKSYGKNAILRSLNICVERGSIYGLLGASGCGKTTLLQSIVCCKSLDSGSIWVMGKRPGSKSSSLPGSGVGYMPQEYALVGEFTVKDAIYYFGRLMEMKEDVIEERFNYFSELLDLPPSDRYVKNCSGGQQRRISFVAAVVHNPKLLILDEPTAGVDSLLREKIWNYLVEVAQTNNTAVIITTHYIEEARHSHKVGLMRKGKILAEDSPNNLIARYNADTLEDVFLVLSRHQDIELGNNHQQEQSDNLALQPYGFARYDNEENSDNAQKSEPYKRSQIKYSRIKALMDKNWKQFYRNPTVVIFNLLMPVSQALFFLIAIGKEVQDIPFAIVNDEAVANSCSHLRFDNSVVYVSENECNFSNISCRFLSYLDDPMIRAKYYDNLEDAMAAVRVGKVAGVMYMAENFTQSFQARFEDGIYVEAEDLEFGQIKVWLDMSNRQVGMSVKGKLWKLYTEFEKDLYRDCHLVSKLVESPLDFDKPLFGKLDDEFVNFICPAMILILAFSLATQMTTQIIVTERSEGVWERSAVAGVTPLEITITHLLLQAAIVFVQVMEVIIVVFAVYQFECIGSVYLVTAIAYLQGIAGIVFGFWVSIVSTSHTMSNLITTAIFFLTMITCGMLWPIEGMPVVLQWISRSFPFTVAIEACRNIMRKGWTIAEGGVWIGNAITCFWIITFATISVLAMRKK